MRLTPRQILLVKEAVAQHLGSKARVWLFGSRVNDACRGGDFDFYVESNIEDPNATIDMKLAILAQLHATPDFEGEKIDLIIKPALPGPYPSVYRVARESGIQL